VILHVGFTGTQSGMTPAQGSKLVDVLSSWRRTDRYDVVGHHGDCIGADEDFHKILITLGAAHPIIHPPVIPDKRALCEPYSIMMNPLPYLERNRAIVRDSDVLLACPGGFQEELRSGTWATLRYALKHYPMIPRWVIWPDGSWESFDICRF
jgi:hypothetical protein